MDAENLNSSHPNINIPKVYSHHFNFSLQKIWCYREVNLFDIWELCKLVIISHNLMTFTFDPRVIL